MAINNQENAAEALNPQATQAEAPKASFASTKTEATGFGGAWSFHGNDLFGAPISRGVGSEVFLKLKTALTEIYKTAHEDVEISLIDLDNISEPLAFSSIIVAVRLKRQPQRGVAYHLLILEGTGEKLTPYFEQINNQQIEVLRVPSDALDSVLLEKAYERVQRAYPTGPWYCVDGTVVPESFNVDDKYAVHRLALNTGLAANSELQIQDKNFLDVNLATLQRDSALSINIAFNNQQIEDAVGLPLRSDFSIQLSSKKNNVQRNVSVNSGDREVPVSTLTGFLDLVWAPVANAGYQNIYAPQVAAPTQKYVSRLILSSLANNFSYTPASVLLALATASTLRDDNNWIQAFRPTPPQGKQVDLRDIGALNIEANLMNSPTGFGERVRTKEDSFGLADLGQYVAALIQPGLLISVDVPEVGAQSWYLNVFAAAAAGSQGAYTAIYDAAQELTNGAFKSYFPEGSLMFVDTNNRIHAGTWTDINGRVRDLRDFDHLAVCNLLGERNPVHIKDWSDTFLYKQLPLNQRLAARKKMIMDLSNQTAVFTGFYQRVTFSDKFVDALLKGIGATGFQLARINTPLSGADFTNARGVADFVDHGLVRPGQSFANAGGFGYSAAQFGNSYVSSGRWNNR